MAITYSTQDVVTMHVRVAMLFRQDKQADVAAVLGIRQPGISRRFSGEVPWTLDEVDALAGHFGCKPSDLLLDVPDFLGSITIPEDRVRYRQEHFDEVGLPRRRRRTAPAQRTTDGWRRDFAASYELAA